MENDRSVRKIFGIGETVFDILFRDNQPIGAKPGGSVYNALITLGRLGLKPAFISEIGDDKIGHLICDFLKENEVETKYIYSFDRGKTPLALAFLDEKQNADYLFYKDYPSQRLDYITPRIDENDIVLIGSYFALNPVLRDKVVEFLEYAQTRKAIIYYDVNFRKSHINDVRFLMPSILENYEFADIVKGSDEDFMNIYGESDGLKVYKENIEYYSKNFIYTQGEHGAKLFSKGVELNFSAKTITPKSTIGAGDNFNAGIVFGLLRENITREDLKNGLSEELWNKIVQVAIDFSSEVCTTLDNYVSVDFAKNYLKG
ncbi:MAG: carbohydrate kinase [Paludibacteraceae bacterium]|nr:carbohydrate kinase [Paludibacteraceae bacterium]MBQ9099780.1 carbohydrate kinase [Paludibacteraceae bacterium]